MLLNAVPGPRSAEEARDQTALQNLLLRIERPSQRMEEEVDHGGKCQEMGMFSWEISETKKFILFSQWEFQDPKIRGTVNHIFCHILWLYPLT